MKTLIVVLSVCWACFCSCQQKGEPLKSLSVDEFETLIADPDVQRLDVRTVAEFSEGHIPGSINLNAMDKNFASMADSVLQKDKPVAVYCRGGKRSKEAAAILIKQGYKVFDLDKGFNSWKETGKEVAK